MKNTILAIMVALFTIASSAHAQTFEEFKKEFESKMQLNKAKEENSKKVTVRDKAKADEQKWIHSLEQKIKK